MIRELAAMRRMIAAAEAGDAVALGALREICVAASEEGTATEVAAIGRTVLELMGKGWRQEAAKN